MICTALSATFTLACPDPARPMHTEHDPRRWSATATMPATMEHDPPPHGALPGTDGDHDPAQPAPDLFSEGTRVWALFAGSSRDSSLGTIHSVQFERGRFVRDGISISFGATFGYADADQARDGVLGGPEVNVRWHLLRSGHGSLFIEGSAGIVLHQHPLTPESMNFNFDLKAGFGVAWKMNERTALLCSLRWHHLSNARARGKRRNLGYDGPMVTVGIMRSF